MEKLSLAGTWQFSTISYQTYLFNLENCYPSLRFKTDLANFITLFNKENLDDIPTKKIDAITPDVKGFRS